jgi:hypothetical protein
MQPLVHLGAFTKTTRDIINTNFLQAAFGTVGKAIYVNPAVGYDNSGDVNDPNKPFDTLTKAYAAGTTGKNDVFLVVGDGGTTGTVREDLALAFSKSATHVIGLTAPSLYGQRARIAPTSTTVGASTNKAYVTVSGSGSLFANLQIWAGFATGIANTWALTVSGSRNVFKNIQIVGHADAVSAADAGSASLRVSGSENLFEDCVIGTDTVLRSAANASVLFSGGAARNVFRNCIFPVYTSATTSLIWAVAASNPDGTDRETIFENCYFLNMLNVTSAATMAAAATHATNAVNGFILLKDCVRMGITDWGTDATTNARIYASGSGDEAQAGDEVGRAHVAIAS